MRFEGKKVLVTGGTRGIGRAAVEQFLAEGATVAVNGRTAGSVGAALEQIGDPVFGVPGDTSTAQGCQEVVDGAVVALGGLDVLVNNAGSGGGGPTENLTEADWNRIIDTNLKGTFFCTQRALTALRAAQGAIVNIASVRAVQGAHGSSIYCASKGGVVSMTKAWAIEFAPDIRVNAVLPGAIDTDMLQALAVRSAGSVDAGYEALSSRVAMGRVAAPSEIANVICYLASDQASYVTGIAMLADGGLAAGNPAVKQTGED